MMRFIYLLFFSLISVNAMSAFLPQGFEADFIQITKKQRGIAKDPVKVFYKYPSNIYFNVKGDAPILYVCNDRNVWIYSPPWIEGEAGEVKIGESSKYCYSKFFDALANGLKNNKLYNVTKNESSAELKFSKEAEAQLSIAKVTLEFKEKISTKTNLLDVQKILIYKSGTKDALALVVETLKKNPKIEDNKFIFIPPKNTNITNIK